MIADHGVLATTFEDVVAAFRSGDRDVAAAMFKDFERRLEGHLGFEDDVLLPALDRDHPTEAAALAEEHRQIRSKLLELAVGVDLHLTRATWVAEFVALLRVHAAREDALLYRWALDQPAAVDAGDLMRRLSHL